MDAELFRDLLREKREALGWSLQRAADEVTDALDNGKTMPKASYRYLELSPSIPKDPAIFRAACAAVGLDTADVLRRCGFREEAT